MSILFEPMTFRSVQLRNRLVVSPMCQYSSENGFANDWHLVHLGSRATGGAGLVFTEATAISPEGRISPADLGIWNDDHIGYLKKITSFIDQHGSVAGIQLAHAGRKASCREPWNGGKQLGIAEGGWKTVAPSAIPFLPGTDIPEALSPEDIKKVIDDFTHAARRSLAAGFRVVELHAAHGYLIHQFLSPLSNQRTDVYGGNFENRTRLLLEITRSVRKVWPETLPLMVRISATDWTSEGWQPADSVALSRLLKTEGVDLIDCSSGGIIPGVKIPLEPNYQVFLAEQIKKEAQIPAGAVGLITGAHQAEAIVAEGKADLVFIAREMLRDPNLPMHAAKALGVDIKWPIQYERAK